MPNRILREGILTSERISKLNWAEEVFYRRLMSVVDDYGRYYATPMLLRAACYPLLLDKVSDPDIVKWISKCEEAGLVRVYPASDGKRYLELVDFKQQVRAKDSKFPAFCEHTSSTCVADDKQMLANAHLVVVGDVVEGEGGSAPAKRGRKTPLPDGFVISERVKVWANHKGVARLDEHLESFVSKCKAHDYRYADWDQAFINAITQDWAKLGKEPAKNPMLEGCL